MPRGGQDGEDSGDEALKQVEVVREGREVCFQQTVPCRLEMCFVELLSPGFSPDNRRDDQTDVLWNVYIDVFVILDVR